MRVADTVPASAADDVLYEVVASAALPVIDISRSVRSVWLRPRAVARLDRVISRTTTPLFVAANAAMALTAVCQLGPARLGRWLAVPTFVLSLAPPLVQVLLMRFEIVLLLLRTYDFWFFSLLWLASMALYSLCLRDLRVLVNAGIWFAMQANIMIDATTSLRESVWLTFCGLFFSGAMLAAITLGAIDDVRDFTVLALNGYVVSAQTVVANGWATCLLVLVRNLYRRRAAIRDHGATNKTVVQCLAYRCRVRLHARSRGRRSGSSLSSGHSVSSVSSADITRPTASFFQNAKMVQMRCMRVKIKFSPRNLVARGARCVLGLADAHAALVALRGAVVVLLGGGGLLTCVSFLPAVPRACRLAALVATALFCGLSLAMYNRQLLAYLVFSFDFAFLSCQISVMHLALCDLYGWDTRAFALAATWLWVHWVLTFDCMPPVLKARLRLRYRVVSVVAVHFVLAHVALVYQMISSDRTAFRDRAILRVAWGESRSVHIYVLPLLVSRLLMTFGWSCRIVWRLLRRNENELIIIQGTVTYINNRRKLKNQEAQFSARMERTKSKAQQLTRMVTRRMSAFAVAVAVAPSVSALSVIEGPSVRDAPVSPFVPDRDSERFRNVAGQVYDASRIVGVVKQPRHPSLDDSAVLDASGPVLFEAVWRERDAAKSHATLSAVMPLEVSRARSGKASSPTALPDKPRSDEEENCDTRDSGEEGDTSGGGQPSFVI